MRRSSSARTLVKTVDRLVESVGRRKGDLKYIQGLLFEVGSTEDEARRRARELDEYSSTDGLLAHISRDLGIDLGLMDPDRPVAELKIEDVQGYIASFEEHVTPLLQARGLAQRNRAPGTLREQLFPGRGARLPDRHPATRFRGAFAPQAAGGTNRAAVDA